MKKLILGILAHVDAGKTTLSEGLLYENGQIRSLGRVDHQDAFLDTNALEKERGITIFSKQARIVTEDMECTLLDTPGHVDFSAEMERTLQVLDYAVLVISGTDGVQGHTRTLWRLLRHYEVPVFLFVNKMDLPGTDRREIQKELERELSDGCVDFSGDVQGTEEFYDHLAMCNEAMLESFMEHQSVSGELIKKAIADREVFPCFYGSALKLDGIKMLWEGLKTYTKQPVYGEAFAARVYKIGRDAQGSRLTYMKVTGGNLHVKDKITYQELVEKADQIRIYSGDKYELVDEVQAGEVCAVTGLTATYPGQGLGAEKADEVPVLEPVLNYRIYLPQDVNPSDMFGKLKLLEEEDPQLHIIWNEKLREIHAQMMGQVQIEILTRLMKERFGVTVTFGTGSIVYKETIARPVEGVGHFEPLRHYAEVHILMEPGEPGSGIQVASACSEDVLDLNWQRLILTHIEEREHPGVLTGSALTDVKFTILTGRAHLKHTEGGDFRQATYRAIRQGLKSTENVLLEPIYAFTLTLPAECVGRAMSDIRLRAGKVDTPEYISGADGDMAVLTGTAPVATMQDYMTEVHAYTRGTGSLTLTLHGYDVCHNAEDVIARMGYDSEADTENPTASVFCAHGAGFLVPWDQVADYMHLDYVYHPDEKSDSELDITHAFGAENNFGRKPEKSKETVGSWELDRELQEIYAREFGMNKEDMLDQERKKWRKKNQADASGVRGPKHDKQGNVIYPRKDPGEEYLIVDGYNIIFAWEDLNELSKANMDSARGKLLDALGSYQGYRGCHVVVVFDAYRTKGHPATTEQYHNIRVVYTKTDETADMYIEKLVHEIGKKNRVTVATNDGLEQLTVMSQGALRMSASNLKEELERTAKEIYEEYLKRQGKT